MYCKTHKCWRVHRRPNPNLLIRYSRIFQHAISASKVWKSRILKENRQKTWKAQKGRLLFVTDFLNVLGTSALDYTMCSTHTLHIICRRVHGLHINNTYHMSRRYDVASKSSKNTTFVGIAVGTWRSWTDVNNNSSVFPCSRYLVIDRTQNFFRNKIKNFAVRFELLYHLYGRKWLLKMV